MNNIIEKDHPNFIFKYYLIMRTYYAFLLRSLRKYKENFFVDILLSDNFFQIKLLKF